MTRFALTLNLKQENDEYCVFDRKSMTRTHEGKTDREVIYCLWL